MKHRIITPALALSAFLGLAYLAGCQTSGHTTATASASAQVDQVSVCAKCYESAVRIKRVYKMGKYTKVQSKVIEKHQCPACKSIMQVYLQDGVPMIQCDKCVPQGIACDRCVARK